MGLRDVAKFKDAFKTGGVGQCVAAACTIMRDAACRGVRWQG
jgi:hypothetical protein